LRRGRGLRCHGGWRGERLGRSGRFVEIERLADIDGRLIEERHLLFHGRNQGRFRLL
jgi:hypothetical protein